ncbi:MAG: DNA recombination protein RmuC [Planctomycetota bacterium]
MSLVAVLIEVFIVIGIVITIYILFVIKRQYKNIVDYQTLINDLKSKVDMIEKFLTPQTIEQLAKKEEVNRIINSFSEISKEIGRLETRVEEKEKYQDSQRQQTINSLNSIDRSLSTLIKEIENVKKSSEPISSLEKNATEIKTKIEELHTKLLGTQTRGQIGERVILEQLSAIPDRWLKRNVELDGKVVEFAILLGEKFIPIDSKVIEAKDEKDAIEKLLTRAGEIKKYTRSTRSLGFAIMAVPDSVREEAMKVYSKLEPDIIIVPYTYLPYIVLFIIANKDRILTNLNSQEILKNLPNVPSALSEALKRVESAKREFSALQNRLNEIQTSLENCKSIIDNIIRAAR